MELFDLLIVVLLFCGLVVLAVWACDKFGFPAPVKYFVGALFLLLLIRYVIGFFGVTMPTFHPQHHSEVQSTWNS